MARASSADPQDATTAAFYCTIEDPRVATVELQRVDGAIQRADVLGKQAVVFPYPATFQPLWPAQHPAAIRLFNASGRPLNLPTTPVGSQMQHAAELIMGRHPERSEGSSSRRYGKILRFAQDDGVPPQNMEHMPQSRVSSADASSSFIRADRLQAAASSTA